MSGGTTQGEQPLLFGSHVVDTRPLGGQATYLRLADGRELVLKGVPRQELSRRRPGEPWCELAVLDLLGAVGAPVPQLLAFDLEDGWLVYEFVSGPTGRELVRDGAPPAGFVLEIAAALRRIENTLYAEQQALQKFTAPDSHGTWQVLSQKMLPLLTPPAKAAWEKLARLALDASALTLGPVDTHAGNVVWHDGQPVFLDFATIGRDFTERRLAAYVQVDGLHAQAALSPAVYTAYAERYGLTASLRLAFFDFLFWGIVWARLLTVVERPNSKASKALTAARPDLAQNAAAQLDFVRHMWARPRCGHELVQAVSEGLV